MSPEAPGDRVPNELHSSPIAAIASRGDRIGIPSCDPSESKCRLSPLMMQCASAANAVPRTISSSGSPVTGRGSWRGATTVQKASSWSAITCGDRPAGERYLASLSRARTARSRSSINRLMQSSKAPSAAARTSLSGGPSLMIPETRTLRSTTTRGAMGSRRVMPHRHPQRPRPPRELPRR